MLLTISITLAIQKAKSDFKNEIAGWRRYHSENEYEIKCVSVFPSITNGIIITMAVYEDKKPTNLSCWNWHLIPYGQLKNLYHADWFEIAANQSLDSEPITWGFPVAGYRQEFGLHKPPWTPRYVPALSSCRSASVHVPITHHAIRSNPLPVGLGPINSVLATLVQQCVYIRYFTDDLLLLMTFAMVDMSMDWTTKAIPLKSVPTFPLVHRQSAPWKRHGNLRFQELWNTMSAPRHITRC
jgi:hypothetical protein